MHILYFIPGNSGAPDFLGDEIRGLLENGPEKPGVAATDAASFGCESLADLVGHVRLYRFDYAGIVIGLQGGRVFPGQFGHFFYDMARHFDGKISAYINDAQAGDQAALLRAGFSFVVGNEDDDEVLSLQLKIMPQAASGEQSRYLRYGPLCLDRVTRDVVCEGSDIQLTGTEKNILGLFMEHAGCVLPRQKIYMHLYSLYGENEKPELKTIDIHVSKLLKKLSSAYPELFTRPSQAAKKDKDRALQSVFGQGYILRKLHDGLAANGAVSPSAVASWEQGAAEATRAQSGYLAWDDYSEPEAEPDAVDTVAELLAWIEHAPLDKAGAVLTVAVRQDSAMTTAGNNPFSTSLGRLIGLLPERLAAHHASSLPNIHESGNEACRTGSHSLSRPATEWVTKAARAFLKAVAF